MHESQADPQLLPVALGQGLSPAVQLDSERFDEFVAAPRVAEAAGGT